MHKRIGKGKVNLIQKHLSTSLSQLTQSLCLLPTLILYQVDAVFFVQSDLI